MALTVPKKVPMRLEHTGQASLDRAQRLAQQVSNAHEQTKTIVQALANHSYVALTTDTGNVAAGAYATLLSTTITTVLASGHIVVTFSASGIQITNAGLNYFQVLVDNVVVKGCYASTETAAFAFNASMVVRVAVTRGTHTVALQWKRNNNSSHINPSTNEEHAHMLVQEVL